MALNIEVWKKDIVDDFFPDDSFAQYSIDDSEFVNAHKVHVPNAGAPSNVETNRSTFPGTAARQTGDQDLEYSIDELTTDPRHITDLEMTELSYNKRQSIIANDKAALQEAAHQNLIYNWAIIDKYTLTSGSNRTAHTSSTATGNRKKITKADVQALCVKFNQDNVPKTDRYLLLDSVMYQDLIADLTGTELAAFQAAADVKKGIVGQLFGFNILERSQVLRVKDDYSAIIRWDTGTAAAKELAAGIAWQKGCVSRALGDLKMFTDANNPLYYGDLMSFLLRVGGKYRRYDKKGVRLIIEDTGV